MLKPAHGGPMIERPGGGDKRATVGRVTGHTSAPKIRVHAIEQEGLVVVDLNIRAETSSLRRLAGGHVKNASLIRVVFNERLCACNHHGTATRCKKRNVFEHRRNGMIAYKNAGVVGCITIQNCSREVDGLS